MTATIDKQSAQSGAINRAPSETSIDPYTGRWND